MGDRRRESSRMLGCHGVERVGDRRRESSRMLGCQGRREGGG